MSAELAARRTAAAAVVADFYRSERAFIDDTSHQAPAPDYQRWALRLECELRSLLDQLDTEASQLAQIRLVLDSFDWETDDRQYALEQVDDIIRGDDR